MDFGSILSDGIMDCDLEIAIVPTDRDAIGL